LRSTLAYYNCFFLFLWADKSRTSSFKYDFHKPNKEINLPDSYHLAICYRTLVLISHNSRNFKLVYGKYFVKFKFNDNPHLKIICWCFTELRASFGIGVLFSYFVFFLQLPKFYLTSRFSPAMLNVTNFGIAFAVFLFLLSLY